MHTLDLDQFFNPVSPYGYLKVEERGHITSAVLPPWYSDWDFFFFFYVVLSWEFGKGLSVDHRVLWSCYMASV